MNSKLIEDNLENSLPYDDFGYVTVENAVKNRIPFFCLNCNNICQIEENYDFDQIDTMVIECMKCNREFHYDSQTKDKLLKTPSFNVISQFDGTKLSIKNHEYAGH